MAKAKLRPLYLLFHLVAINHQTQVLARDKPWLPARRPVHRSRIREGGSLGEGGYSATCGAFRASTPIAILAKN